MGWRRIGSAERDLETDDVVIRISVAPARRYRVLAEDVPWLLAGYAAILYAEGGEQVGDIDTSSSGLMLIGASRAGFGFVPDRIGFPVHIPEFAIPRSHLGAHYFRHDGPIEVLGGGA